MTDDDAVVTGPVRVFRDARAILGESPWFLGGSLHWSDISAGLLHVSPMDGDPGGADDTVLSFPPPLPAFHPAAGGGFVAALGDRVVLADADGTITRELARIEHAHAGLRLNEGGVDPQGRFVTGSMNMTTELPDAAWYMVDDDGARTVLGGVTVANGLEWSLDGRTVYLTDTGVQSILRGPWDPAGGPLDLEPFASGAPHDGLTIDDEGCFWSPLNGEGKVVRLDPDGRTIGSFDLPTPNVTGIAFGGDDRSTLFITSGREKMTEEQLEAAPLSGAVFAVQTAVHGLPPRIYGTGARA